MIAPTYLIRRIFVLVLGDFLVAAGSFYSAALMTGLIPAIDPTRVQGMYAASGLFALASVGALYFNDVYALERSHSRWRLVRSIVEVECGLAIALPFFLLAIPWLNFGRRLYIGYFLIATPSLIVWRLAITTAFSHRIIRGVAILGIGEEAALLASEVIDRGHLGYRFLGFVSYGADERQLRPHPRIHAITSLTELLSMRDLNTLVITANEHASFPAGEVMQLKRHGVEIIGFESFYERLVGRLPVHQISERWLLYAPGFYNSRMSSTIKRAVDMVGALVLGIVSLPLWPLLAIAVKLDSEGPLFYTQRRVGLNDSYFRIYKFRSMRHDAESTTGPTWAGDNDPRITRVGATLRKFRLDELPQLWNVLRGDMSLVGPRPERPEFVGELSKAFPLYDYRHFVRPGLTGWAQVCYPYGATFDDAREKLCYDLYYIKNQSLVLDIQIMLQSTKVVLFGRGSR
ncbi:MAG: sugar transferase [Candidatus Binataceae bacterium]